MPAKHITTELQLQRLKPASKSYDVKIVNAPGLYVRVGKSGSKSFRWNRRQGYTPRVLTYGTYPSLSLSEAKKAHDKMQQSHSAGLLEEGDTEAPKTVAELAEAFYIDRIVPIRKRPDIVRQLLDYDVIPAMGRLRLSSVNTLSVRRTVKVVVDRGAKSKAGKCLGIIKQMFRYGISIGVMDSNPAEPLDKADLGAGDNVRTRALNSDEIKQLWDILDSHSRLSTQVRIGLQLLILLGIRSGELRQAQWKDIDDGLLTIPVSNQKLNPRQVKKAKPFIVPLDDFALSLFDQLRGLDDAWIFPGKVSGPITDKVFGRAVSRLLENHLDIEKFVPHDLRRTMRTGLSSLGVQPHVAELCLNHSLGTIIDTYDIHPYLDERRQALENWSQHIQGVVGKHSSVISMGAVG